MINRIVLVGRLTKDPELRYTPSGVGVTRFTLAVNRTFTNQNGEREADFINCVAWRKQAENVANYLKKGSLAGVDGQIRTNNFEGQDGNMVFMTEVNAESVQFLEPKGANSGQNAGNYNQSNTNTPASNQNGNAGQNEKNNDPFANNGEPVDISEDDLPF